MDIECLSSTMICCYGDKDHEMSELFSAVE